MPNYNESQITGSRWTRCHSVEIQNLYESTKHVRFFEQDVIVLDNNDVVFKPRGAVPLEQAFDPEKVVNLLDPQTGQPTGQTFTHSDLYAMLFSVYLAAAAERDQNLNNNG